MGEFLRRWDEICKFDKEPVKPTVFSEAKSQEKLYNLYKRSVPPGINKLVLMNVPYKDAIKVGTVLNKMEIKRREKGKVEKIYFDMVPSDASFEEQSIYWNPKEFVKEEGSDPGELEILKGPENWIN